MNKRKKIEKHIKVQGAGLEIGPGYNPFFPKKNGYHVKILDHASTEDLILKYSKEEFIDASCFEDVDFVWSGEPYSELIPDLLFDWVFASHVVEHTPDLIGFINNCASVLHQDGVLALVVPDKRYTFDMLRQRSSLSAIIDAHIEKRTKPSLGNVIECHSCCLQKKENNSLCGELLNQFVFSSDINAEQFAQYAANTTYLDVHVWTFTPHHFRMIVERLFTMGLIQVRETAFYPASGNDFIMFLSSSGKGPDLSLIELAQKAQKEHSGHILSAGKGTHLLRNIISIFDRRYFRGRVKKLYHYLRDY